MNTAWSRICSERKRVVGEWANELSVKLERLVSVPLERGLNAGDFPFGQTVFLEFQDESFARFRHSFFAESAERCLVAVFAKHCGYHAFVKEGLTARIA